jgi:predicted ATP-dependent serine protease
MLLNTLSTSFQKCSEIEIPESFYNRMTTGSSEVDRIFGTEYLPGIMSGIAITLCGTPGSGKSTATLQICELLAKQGKRVAIASGEESHVQIAYTAKRLGVTDVDIAHIKDVEVIAGAMKDYDVIVVDSFQALRSNDPNLGKKASLQYAQDLLLGQCKETGCVLIFILHITTSGLPKGGTDIIHAVDVNIKMTVDKTDNTVRVIDVYKNRFGETKAHKAIMGAKGFDFAGEYVEPVEEAKVADKTPTSEKRKEEILSITEPPHLTLDRVCDSLGVSGQTASILLRELVGEKKVQKYGRGANAIWKLAMDCKEIYDTYKK